MENIDLKQYPLATLFAWRAPIFLGKQGATDEASERRVIRARVAAELTQRQRENANPLDATNFDDLI